MPAACSQCSLIVAVILLPTDYNKNIFFLSNFVLLFKPRKSLASFSADYLHLSQVIISV